MRDLLDGRFVDEMGQWRCLDNKWSKHKSQADASDATCRETRLTQPDALA